MGRKPPASCQLIKRLNQSDRPVSNLRHSQLCHAWTCPQHAAEIFTTSCSLRNSSARPRAGQYSVRFPVSLFSKCPDRLHNTSSILFSSNRRVKHPGRDAEHSHLMPWLKMCGTLPPRTTYATLSLYAQNTNCRGHSLLRNPIFLHAIQNIPAARNFNCVRKHNPQNNSL